jgi:Tol biopolymer transport system component
MGLLLAGLVAWSLIPATAHALHRETGGAVRIAPAVHSRGRSWANYLAFSSERNVVDPVPVGRQIYLYNHFLWVCQRGTPEPATAALCPNPPVPFLTRVTNGPGAPDNPSVSDAIDIDGDGTPDAQWLAYDADGGHNGGTGCEASRRQIFLKEIYSGEVRQITFACNGDSTHPTLAFHGGLLAFQSTGSIVNPPTPAGVSQIYTYFKNDLVLRRITSGAGASINPMINKVGTKVAFQSSADLLGTNADTGVSQIFWADYDRQKHTSVIHQLTDGNGDSGNPYIAEDAPMIAFDSLATDLPGAISPSGQQIYVARSDSLPSPDLPPVTQLTNEGSLGNCSFPAIDPSNNRVGFLCTNDAPSPTARNRAYSFDLGTGQLFSVSAASDIQGPVSQSIGQWFMSLATSFDLLSQQSCGSQLHVVDFFSGPTDGSSIIGLENSPS